MERELREKALFGVRACPQCGEDKNILRCSRWEADMRLGEGCSSFYLGNKTEKVWFCGVCGCKWEET